MCRRGARHAAAASGAQAQDVKIGFILPMTGQQQSTGKQEAAGAKLFMQQNGDTVAGKKVELIIKDDGAVPDNSKRIAQDLIVNDKVTFLAGFGVTPAALAVAPLATESKTPEIVTAAGTSIITQKSRLHRAHELHARAIDGAARRLGGAKRHQESREHGVRLRAGRGRGEILRRRIHREGRPDPRQHHLPAGQSGFRAVPATRRRPEARCGLRLRAVRPRRHLRQAVRRARHGQSRHQDHRPGRRDRRRSGQRHGRLR